MYMVWGGDHCLNVLCVEHFFKKALIKSICSCMHRLHIMLSSEIEVNLGRVGF